MPFCSVTVNAACKQEAVEIGTKELCLTKHFSKASIDSMLDAQEEEYEQAAYNW